MIPVANFTFIPTGLSLQFTDLSENIPTSWSWDFGDLNSSLDQNPLHVYAAAGRYTVKLTATNGDGSHQVIYTIVVAVTPTLYLAIRDIVTCKVPAAIPIDQICKDNYVAKWQLYLQILVDPNISDANVFDESKWPPLVNMLIAELVAWELISEVAQQALTNTLASSTTTTTPSALGGLKKVKTGPAEAEYYDGSGTASDVLKNVFGPGGVFEMLKKTICTTSARLRVTLPMCPPLAHGPVIPKKQGRPPEADRTSPFVASTG